METDKKQPLLDKIYVNGGKKGFLVEITASDLNKALTITKIEIAIKL
ncbi:MAG: hypothetical protein QME25_06780 [Bacteroidota bacterium]|nr:hypothetical protein [Bacteroidota bacterium]